MKVKDSKENLMLLTVDKLKQKCKKHKISGYSGLNKKELVKLLKKYMKEGDERYIPLLVKNREFVLKDGV
jgi:hypothetical protein